eukprot:TRINITY_DN18129_c0_g1_i1.p1 TRINITY_DN18129_c0_g1~~TRINITY_DN18129_c0_g1_i1.p1  ORF type:complete len:508 (-),score=86.66 TRINITY_DN18129_c0_g1_i1:102-1625(-)
MGSEKDSSKHEKPEEVEPIVFEKETSFSVVSRKCKSFFQNITLEPVMLFYGVVRSIDSIASSQLILDKTCMNDFDFGQEICDNLVDWKENNTLVQNEVAQFKVYESIVDHIFPIICSFFLGSWSDSFGRKWLLYLYFLICLIQNGSMMLNAYFMDWPKEFLLFSVNLPVALSGGHITFSMGIAAFITEISTPEQRTFRLATIGFVEGLGGPLGTMLGAYLWNVGGYLCVFGTSLVGKLMTLIFLVIRLEMFKWNPGKVEETERPTKKRNALSLSHIKDSFTTCFKKRENGKRFYLLTYTAVMLTIFLPFFGEHAIGYNYVRTRYNWGMVEYSNYRSICSVIDLIGQGILIPLIGYLNIKDTNIIPLIICTIISRHVIKGLAYVPWLMYLGSGVDLLGRYSFSAARSATSKCVEMHELGKVFALLYSIESLVPMAMTQIYASLWKATSTVPGIGETQWVGSCFFLSAILTSIALFLSIMAWFRLGGKDITELDRKEPTKATFQQNNEL